MENLNKIQERPRNENNKKNLVCFFARLGFSYAISAVLILLRARHTIESSDAMWLY